MLLHIFLQVICRRVVFALLGRLAGKNSAAFWDTFSVDLSTEEVSLITRSPFYNIPYEVKYSYIGINATID